MPYEKKPYNKDKKAVHHKPFTITVAQSESRESSLSMPSQSNVSERSELTMDHEPWLSLTKDVHPSNIEHLTVKKLTF